MSRSWTTAVVAVLAIATVVDVWLSAMTWVYPQWWFANIHGTGVDPAQLAFLRRCGANWAAFAILQVLALWRWRRERWWLVLVAGVRLSDVFTDWTYLANSDTVTATGQLGLIAPGLLNLGMALLLLAAWKRATA